MCGIAGCSYKLIQDNPEKYLGRMNEVMHHRGPDDGGVYFDDEMALCHRRLSIIDLTTKGHQPMKSFDNLQTIAFNGEIYNFLQLREDLEERGYRFSTKTDTEVLLNSYKESGVESLKSLRGMFAFAIWDKADKSLFIARDRIGKKPLYYYYDGKNIAFASEIKSLLEIPNVRKEIDPTAIIDYLKYLYIPHPKSIYKNIFKLEPGHYLIFKEGKITIFPYWDVQFSSPINTSVNEIADELLAVIDESVQARLISDVPLGAFLSAGIDSSAIVALMAKKKQQAVKTCTIGFEDNKFNEAVFAREFSSKFKTDHYEYYLKENHVAGLIKKLLWHFDEPFADSSMVPTYHVSNMARKNVTVAISGDGGDESFGGYAKYVTDLIENRVRNIVPSFLLKLLTSTFEDSDSGVRKKIHSLASSAARTPAEGIYITNTFFPDDLLASVLSDKIKRETNTYDPFYHTHRYYANSDGIDHLSRVLYTDLKSYLPGDILVKVDRMSMANSLEVRSPFLDHKVIEYAARIPSTLKIKGKEKKHILKKSFERILPNELLNRKKHGFEVSLNQWFRTDLNAMAFDALFQREYMHEFFNIEQIKKIWEKHQEEKANFGTILWSLLVFSLWYEIFMV